VSRGVYALCAARFLSVFADDAILAPDPTPATGHAAADKT
jgi:hypothetical protein